MAVQANRIKNAKESINVCIEPSPNPVTSKGRRISGEEMEYRIISS